MCAMTMLNELKITTAKPMRMVNQTEHYRAVALRYLEEQKEFATAHIENKPFQATKAIYQTDTLGDRVRSEVRRHVRRGWFCDVHGTVYFAVRYGTKTIDLTNGGNAIEVGKIEALPAIIDMLIQAVKAGELDRQLATAAERTPHRVGGKVA